MELEGIISLMGVIKKKICVEASKVCCLKGQDSVKDPSYAVCKICTSIFDCTIKSLHTVM